MSCVSENAAVLDIVLSGDSPKEVITFIVEMMVPTNFEIENFLAGRADEN